MSDVLTVEDVLVRLGFYERLLLEKCADDVQNDVVWEVFAAARQGIEAREILPARSKCGYVAGAPTYCTTHKAVWPQGTEVCKAFLTPPPTPTQEAGGRHDPNAEFKVNVWCRSLTEWQADLTGTDIYAVGRSPARALERLGDNLIRRERKSSPPTDAPKEEPARKSFDDLRAVIDEATAEVATWPEWKKPASLQNKERAKERGDMADLVREAAHWQTQYDAIEHPQVITISAQGIIKRLATALTIPHLKEPLDVAELVKDLLQPTGPAELLRAYGNSGSEKMVRKVAAALTQLQQEVEGLRAENQLIGGMVDCRDEQLGEAEATISSLRAALEERDGLKHVAGCVSRVAPLNCEPSGDTLQNGLKPQLDVAALVREAAHWQTQYDAIEHPQVITISAQGIISRLAAALTTLLGEVEKLKEELKCADALTRFEHRNYAEALEDYQRAVAECSGKVITISTQQATIASLRAEVEKWRSGVESQGLLIEGDAVVIADLRAALDSIRLGEFPNPAAVARAALLQQGAK